MSKLFFRICYSRIIFLVVFYSFLTQSLEGQSEKDLDIAAVVYLDSFVVTAKRQGFDVADFIDLVRKDKSFYEAFHNLRTASYESASDFLMFDKRGKNKARYESVIAQFSDGDCRTMEFLSEKASGNFYKKKKKYRYYTAKMFDRLFYTHGRECESKLTKKTTSAKGMEKHVAELKKLIFQPGEQVDVPLIGKKTAIFSQKQSLYYNYSISSKTYKDSFDCYVFGVKVKPEFARRKSGKTIIKNLETYFDKKTFQVVARNYTLQYQSAAFDFDVTMDVQLLKRAGKYYPEKIKYVGRWDIPTKKPEIAQFEVDFYKLGQ